MAGPSWKKSPAELVDAFSELAGRYPELSQRKMFGYPAAFLAGNMTTCLHEERWIVRLGEADRAVLLARPGAGLFEPMPGRPMREYVVLPGDIVADPEATAGWIERAIAHARTLPPKR
jgi:TfoX/Sxy family transcriptional regulator of competence genes